MPFKTISFREEERVVEMLDEVAEAQGFQDRSTLIRQILRKYLGGLGFFDEEERKALGIGVTIE